PFEAESNAFELEGVSAIQKITVLRSPTPRYPPPSGKNALWRLISHLSLNYLSLVSGKDNEGKKALQEILALYNFSDTPETKKEIEGIVNVESRPHVTALLAEHGITAARGTRVRIGFDEEQF